MPLVILGHILFTSVCLWIGDKSIIFLNLLAICVDILSLLILLSGRKNLSFSLILTYITLYNSYIIYVVGLNTSFTLYYITLIAFIFVTDWKLSTKIYYVVGMLLVFLAAAYYSFDHTLIVFDDIALLGVNVVNTVICGLALMLIVFNYENVTKKSEEELHEMYLSKERLYSIIAHDLKGPIGAVAGIAELVSSDLKNAGIDPSITKLVDTMEKTTRNTSTLLENLLYWANNKKGEMKPQIKKVNLNAIFDDCISLHRTQIEQKSLKVSKESGKAICLGDEEMIFTVFRNLVSNAIKFSVKGGDIGLFVTENSEYLTVKIVDSGIGMSRDMLSDAFKVDNKKVRTGTNNESGTGLGLVLCKELIKKNRGKIWIESEVNKGTEVFIQLPATA